MEDLTCDKCQSENLSFVRYVFSNDTQHLRKQCNDCGRVLSKGYKRTVVPDFWSLPEVDEVKRKHLWDTIKKISLAKSILLDFRLKRIAKDKEYYKNVYLLSSEWGIKRQAVMDAYNWECQKCDEKATQLHHTTYDNIFKEKFEDLLPLCRSCHEKEHQKSNP